MRASRIRDADTDTDMDAGGQRVPGAGSDGVAAVRLPGHVEVAGVGEGGRRRGAARRIRGERGGDRMCRRGRWRHGQLQKT